jgi:DNA topoisomerase-3
MSRRKVLNIAEKQSVAREIVTHLGSSVNRRTVSGQAVSDFPFNLFGRPCEMTVTAVRGHLMELDFADGSTKSWTAVDPIVLFESPIRQSVGSGMQPIASCIAQLARQADTLVLWLDCDREGEAIAFEVVEVCMHANRNLEIFRATFSALTRSDLIRACENLTRPNPYFSQAVLARSEIDLRIGAVFTRWLTLRFQSRLANGNSGERRLVSFGTCQFPTLGFVVARHLARERFVSENFWSLRLVVKRPQDPKSITLLWDRNRLFDRVIVMTLMDLVGGRSAREAVVIEQKNQPKSKWRPLPLNTLEMTKLASSHLRIASHRCMQIAEI